MVLVPETRLPIIDHGDITGFAVAALTEPERFRNAELSLFSEMKDSRELMKMPGSAMGRPFSMEFMSEGI